MAPQKYFYNEYWKALDKKYKCDKWKSSPYNPQSNPVERTMREIGRILRAKCNKNHNSWGKYVLAIEK